MALLRDEPLASGFAFQVDWAFFTEAAYAEPDHVPFLEVEDRRVDIELLDLGRVLFDDDTFVTLRD